MTQWGALLILGKIRQVGVDALTSWCWSSDAWTCFISTAKIMWIVFKEENILYMHGCSFSESANRCIELGDSISSCSNLWDLAMRLNDLGNARGMLYSRGQIIQVWGTSDAFSWQWWLPGCISIIVWPCQASGMWATHGNLSCLPLKPVTS